MVDEEKQIPENPEAGEEEHTRYRYRPMGVAMEEDFSTMEGGHWSEDEFFFEFKDGSFYDKYGYFFDENGVDEYGGYYESFEDGEQKELMVHFYVPNPDFEVEYILPEDGEDFDFVHEEVEFTEEGRAEYEEHLYTHHVLPAVEYLRKKETGKKSAIEVHNIGEISQVVLISFFKKSFTEFKFVDV
jgi:hypothetical protein